MSKTLILQKLFNAADNHGEDTGEPDHTVGDLQDLLRKSWDLMLPSQKLALLESSEVEEVIQAGARGEFEAEDLVRGVEGAVAQADIAISQAGYTIIENEEGFHWETDEEYGRTFDAREDAVMDAYAELKAVPTANNG